MIKLASAMALLTLAAGVGPTVPCSPVIKYPSVKKAFKYDLTSLWHSSGDVDNLYGYDENYNTIVSVNICGESSLSCVGPVQSAACGFIGQDPVSYGDLKTQAFYAYNGMEPGKGVNVTYSGGTRCSSGGKHSVHVLIKCSDAIEPYVYTAEVDGYEACEANLYVYAQAGCGVATKYSNGGLGAGGIILIM